jgi:hypothetical protein
MTRNQFIATSSFLGFIPAAGLMAVIAFGVAGGASDFNLATWVLYGATFITAILALASPVAVFFAIPKDADVATLPLSPAEPTTDDSIDGEEEVSGSSDTDGDFEAYDDESDDYDGGATEVANLDGEKEYNPAETEVASLDSEKKYDDDGDFQVGDEFEDEFDDFDDDEDFT